MTKVEVLRKLVEIYKQTGEYASKSRFNDRISRASATEIGNKVYEVWREERDARNSKPG